MNYLLLRTNLGRKFTLEIAEELRRMGNKAALYKHSSIDIAFEKHPWWNKDNLIIHARFANPKLPALRDLEETGYRIVNKVDVLELTSDKWKSTEKLFNSGNLPHTELVDKRNLPVPDFSKFSQYLVAKPRTSPGGGKTVNLFNKRDLLPTKQCLLSMIDNIPGNFVLLQSKIPYTAIYRVFVIGGKSLPFVTKDVPTPENWKVSVCLNQKQTVVKNPDKELLKFAEDLQKEIGGEINFIDVFETEDGYVLSEINTACSLLTHERLSGFNIARSIAEYLNSLKEKA